MANKAIAPRLIELFAGCGGMAVGLAKAGFQHDLLVEWNKAASSTVMHNVRRGISSVHNWKYVCSDVRNIDWRDQVGRVAMVAGGPPCQPFSMGGKAKGHLDLRDMWPEAVRAVRETQPKAFLFENVKGILRVAFVDYVRLIEASLCRPSVERRENESVQDFSRRLTKLPVEYVVRRFLVNAADYGAGQKRHRVLFAGFRCDLDLCPTRPPETHSEDRLLWDQWITGEYWGRHGLARPNMPTPSRITKSVARLLAVGQVPNSLAWHTCRDVFVGLGEPSAGSSISNHQFQAGAQSYPGHTGSPIDEPAKALKAGTHGVPGGENMILFSDGRVRYFSVREAARLQGMPDDYDFPSVWSESMRQLGNAVPTQLAEAFGHMMINGLGKK